MIDKPAPVPQKQITSVDVPNFASGLNLNGPQNAQVNSFVASKDIALTPDGYIVPRPSLVPFLPDTVGSVYQIYPVIWGGVVYYITADQVATPGVTTNLIANPNFETNLTGWTLDGDSTITKVSTSPYVGTYCCQVVVTAGGNGYGGMFGTAINVSFGQTYTYSAWVKSASGTVNLKLTTRNGSGGVVRAINQPIVGNGSWQRVSMIITLASNEVNLTPSVYAAAEPLTFYFDAAMLQSGSTASTYFDGATAASYGITYAWTGTANASTSTKTVSATAGQIIYCKEGDAGWTIAGTQSGGVNQVTLNGGGKTEFLRVLDHVLILNGTNGDKLANIDLSTTPFKVGQYSAIADPSSAPTVTLTNLTNSGSFYIYYAYTFTTSTGETNLSPILTYNINIVRDQWGNNTASPSSIKVTRAAAPAGAQFWNLYIALAATGGTIVPSNMLQLATGLDLATTAFVDDGTLGINLGGPPPTNNSTDGPKVDHGIVEQGNPILYGDVTTPANIWIGAGGNNALSFSSALGGYKAQPNLGTNFQVTQVIGFRNGQGIPSLTVLFSNTQGLSEQAVLEQQTVTYGNTTFSVWGVTSQHYGAAGVAAADSAINYNGKLVFMSTDGLMMMNTQPLRQNVISTDNLTIKTMAPYVQSIKNSAMKGIVGAAWDKRYMWTMPAAGFDTPQQILVMDDNNQVPENDNNGAFYTYNVPAQWIGVVSPANEAAFIYVTQDNHSFKLGSATATFDTRGGVPVPFSTSATGALVPMSPSGGRNVWQADVQVLFYVVGLVGSITVGVTYRNQNGKLKTKTKTYNGPTYTPAVSGGWGDTQWTYGNFPAIPGWGRSPKIDSTLVPLEPLDVRIPVQIDDIMNEAQWFFSTDADFNNFKLRVINFEGINLGVRPDLQ